MENVVPMEDTGTISMDNVLMEIIKFGVKNILMDQKLNAKVVLISLKIQNNQEEIQALA